MKEEGFVNRALSVVADKQVSGRWLANQAHFNNSDDKMLNPNAKATVIFSLNVFNTEVMHNQLDKIIERAHAATTEGEFREIISDTYKLMPEELNPV